MTFKDLPIGAMFEFYHGHIRHQFSGMATGPWVKTAARQYRRYDDNDATTVHTVGTVRVGVRQLTLADF